MWTTSRPRVTEEPFDEQVSGGAFFGSIFPSAGALTYTLYGGFLPRLGSISGRPQADKSAGARLELTSLAGWSAGASYFAFSRAGRWNHLGGVDAMWRRDRIELSAELLIGRGDPNGNRLGGGYAQAALECVPHVFAVGRYEHFEPGAGRGTLDLFDLGLAWRPIPFLILKADYLIETRRSASEPPGIRASISLLF